MFSSRSNPAENSSLHYAERMVDLTVVCKGEIKGVNTAALEGVPNMDEDGMRD
ncbi:hypothetical protein [Singulisphaera sp. GP187]|uniref:hypothetical protein n=1 Tax=Singulisphaera sp. GP187 TaxID=1882752 RepID=UPI00135658F5|nr:hypothetical protein [Singulisphaera sp. GP187]